MALDISNAIESFPISEEVEEYSPYNFQAPEQTSITNSFMLTRINVPFSRNSIIALGNREINDTPFHKLPYDPHRKKLTVIAILVLVLLSTLYLKRKYLKNLLISHNIRKTIGYTSITLIKKSFSLFFYGNYEQAILYLAKAAKHSTDIEKAFMLLESYDFKEAVKCFDDIFLNILALKDAYLLIKAIIITTIKLNTLSPEYLDPFSQDPCVHLDKILKQCRHREVKAIALYNKSLVLYSVGHENQAQKCYFRSIKLHDMIEHCKFSHIGLYNFLEKYYGYQPIIPLENRDRSNKVIVRTWIPTSSTETGHSSMQTHTHYISYWPANPINISLKGPKNKSHAGRNFHSYLDDLKAEGRLPEKIAVIYTLNTANINSAYIDFQNKAGRQWALTGSILWDNNNCAGLVRYLLEKGGIGEKFGVQTHHATTERTLMVEIATIVATLTGGGILAAISGSIGALLSVSTVTPIDVSIIASLAAAKENIHHIPVLMELFLNTFSFLDSPCKEATNVIDIFNILLDRILETEKKADDLQKINDYMMHLLIGIVRIYSEAGNVFLRGKLVSEKEIRADFMKIRLAVCELKQYAIKEKKNVTDKMRLFKSIFGDGNKHLSLDNTDEQEENDSGETTIPRNK